MTRAYKGVRLKSHRVYSVEDLMHAFNVSRNTITNWVCAGLTPSDKSRPHLFRGAVVSSFLKQRAERTRRQLRPGEFKCFGCKMVVIPEPTTLKSKPSSSGAPFLQASCPDCSAIIHKLGKQADLDAISEKANTNTTGDSLYEGIGPLPAGIGICKEQDSPDIFTLNDRITYKWQTYAGRFDEKTVNAHLATLRYFEELLRGKNFALLTIEDVSQVREELKRRVSKGSADNLSTSTIKHRASYLMSFLTWLLKQQGFDHLPRDLADYLQLPRAAFAAALARKPRVYPSIEEAAELLSSMPNRTMLEKRQRAIFALAFLGALRADTVISLKIKHIDIVGRRIIQDGTVVRSKNGKSEYIVWFPIPPCFEEEVVSWVSLLRKRDFRDDDALFPSSDWLQDPLKSLKRTGWPFPVMSTKHAVTKAFATASKSSDQDFTPHSAKHTIGALRDELPLTHAQRRAWSENMGHDREQVTEIHYAKLTVEKRAEVLENIRGNEETALNTLSDQEKIDLVDGVIAMISPKVTNA